jgi:hypothetical protein
VDKAPTKGAESTAAAPVVDPKPPAPDAATASPATIVEAFYKTHDNGKGPILSLEGEKTRLQYLDSTLSALIQKNLVGPPNGDVGNLDFDILYNAQETNIRNFKVGDATINGETATVPVTFDNFDRKENLTYTLRRTAAGWRISNIGYGEGEQDLVKILNTPWG